MGGGPTKSKSSEFSFSLHRRCSYHRRPCVGKHCLLLVGVVFHEIHVVFFPHGTARIQACLRNGKSLRARSLEDTHAATFSADSACFFFPRAGSYLTPIPLALLVNTRRPIRPQLFPRPF